MATGEMVRVTTGEGLVVTTTFAEFAKTNVCVETEELEALLAGDRVVLENGSTAELVQS